MAVIAEQEPEKYKKGEYYWVYYQGEQTVATYTGNGEFFICGNECGFREKDLRIIKKISKPKK